MASPEDHRCPGLLYALAPARFALEYDSQPIGAPPIDAAGSHCRPAH